MWQGSGRPRERACGCLREWWLTERTLPLAPLFLLPACRGFKALKQIVKLLFKLGRREEMMEAYK